MKTELFPFVGAYARGLDVLSHVLAKGAVHAAATGASEAEMLEWRLADDMFPLRRQAQTVINYARQWPARMAGLEPAPSDFQPVGLADLQASIEEAKAFLSSLSPEQFAGRDGLEIEVDIGQAAPRLPIGRWVVGFATPNFYFHLTTAYAILRARGAPLGKRDFFAAGL